MAGAIFAYKRTTVKTRARTKRKRSRARWSLARKPLAGKRDAQPRKEMAPCPQGDLFLLSYMNCFFSVRPDLVERHASICRPLPSPPPIEGEGTRKSLVLVLTTHASLATHACQRYLPAGLASYSLGCPARRALLFLRLFFILLILSNLLNSASVQSKEIWTGLTRRTGCKNAATPFWLADSVILPVTQRTQCVCGKSRADRRFVGLLAERASLVPSALACRARSAPLFDSFLACRQACLPEGLACQRLPCP